MSAARSSTATGTIATADDRPVVARGRFAPSPTGPLHRGSLLAAVGSYLDARATGGEWLVRIEDVDRGREAAGAADDILRTLEHFGLLWDGAVLRQQARGPAYEAALEVLAAAGRTYGCSCTRAELDVDSGDAPLRYPGTCRGGPRRRDVPLATRLRVHDLPPLTVQDRIHGSLTQSLDDGPGDFVLRRRDGYYAYQLAVVVDDAAQGVTDVVRGLDLWDNTPRQVALQQMLGLPTPRYLHLPVLVGPDGAKLSKSRGSLAAERAATPGILAGILDLLLHPPPRSLRAASPPEQLGWAITVWNPDVLQGVKEILVET